MKTENIGSFCEGFSLERVPASRRDLAGRAFLDTIGAILAGARMEQVRMAEAVLEWGREKTTGFPAQGATVLGSGTGKKGLFDAVFLNGVSAHSCEYNDLFWKRPGHPSAVLVPVVLGLGERLHKSGKEVLEAYLCGLEVLGRLNEALMPEHHERGFHSTSTAGIIGAAAAGGKLLGLDREKTENACSLACTFACGLRGNLGYTANSLHVGNGAAAGLRAACFSQAGIWGNPRLMDMEEGYFQAFGGQKERLEEQMALLGKVSVWENPGILLKKYPVCYSAFQAIEAAQGLREEYRIREMDIAEIECLTSPNHYRSLPASWPDSIYGQRFCVPFCVCWLLSGGAADAESFSQAHYRRPNLQALRERMNYGVELRQRGIRDFGSTVIRVVLKDGRVLERRAYPGPEDRVESWGEEARRNKLEECAGYFLGKAGVEKLWEDFKDFEGIEDVSVWIEERFS